MRTHSPALSATATPTSARHPRPARARVIALLATLLVPAAAGSAVVVSSHSGHRHGVVTADLGWDAAPNPTSSPSHQ